MRTRTDRSSSSCHTSAPSRSVGRNRTKLAAEGHTWGFYNALHSAADLETQALALARSLADGPWLAHGVTKSMLNQEWDMSLDDLIDAEARAQAQLMTSGDFRRAFEAFAAKSKPRFEGN